MASSVTLVFVLALCTKLCAANINYMSEGTYFAFAAPHSSYTAAYDTVLTFTAKVEATVTVWEPTQSTQVNVPAGGSASFNVPDSLRVSNGLETKGLYVVSNEPIQVFSSPALYAGPRIPDATQLRPVTSIDDEAILASFHSDIECDRVPRAFYSVVGTTAGTNVQVYRKSGGSWVLDDEFTLDSYEVYTKDAYYEAGSNYLLDYTGAFVTATNPIAVYSGQGCVVNAGQIEWINQYYHEAAPSPAELGSNYVTIPYAFGEEGQGYDVRVISTTDGTVVDVSELGINVVVNSGDFYEFTTPSAHTAYKVSCSTPCGVAQYSKEVRNTGGNLNEPIGGFMNVLSAEGAMSDDVLFEAPHLSSTGTTYTALSIIAFDGPVTELYFDDVNLDTLTWTTVGTTNHVYTVIDDITSGVHRLYTTNEDNRFLAYIHTVDSSSGNAISFGQSTGFGIRQLTGTTPSPTTTTTETTTTPSPEYRVPPLYKIILLGNFTATDNYTQECADDYNTNLRDEASQKIPSLNQLIGVDLCSRFPVNDFVIVSVSTAFKAVGSEGSTEIAYLLSNENYHRIEEVYECADEINVYLQDFANWNNPIIPPVQGCPQPIFQPPQFFDGTTGRDWVCLPFVNPSDNQAEEAVIPYEVQRDPPGYSLSIYDNFTTILNEELDVDCTRTYTNDWETTVLAMTNNLNNMINNGLMCTEVTDRFRLLTSTASFTETGSEGSISATFYSIPTNDSVKFEEVYACIDEIFAYIDDHNNWGSLPILPAPEGCPLLVFNPAVFYNYGEAWECLDPIQSKHLVPVKTSEDETGGTPLSWLRNILQKIV